MQQQVLPEGQACVSSHITGPNGGGEGGDGGDGWGLGAGGLGERLMGNEAANVMPHSPCIPVALSLYMRVRATLW
jgi:hypothetical protein